jgi:hypothetical protein
MSQYFILDDRGMPRRILERNRWETWLLRAKSEPAIRQLVQVGQTKVGHLFVKTAFIGSCEDDGEKRPAQWESIVISTDKNRPHAVRKQTGGGRSQAEALHAEMLRYAQGYLASRSE